VEQGSNAGSGTTSTHWHRCCAKKQGSICCANKVVYAVQRNKVGSIVRRGAAGLN